MPARNPDLHGNVPDTADTALLLIDVINDLEWEGGEQIFPEAMKMAAAIAELKKRALRAKVPAIYVNDNFGRWKSDFKAVMAHVANDGTRGAEMLKLLKPDREDYFVLKPKHSGFFSTTLDTLLEYLQVKTLIITGIQTNICVLFTANEAYMRDFYLYVPSDCCASQSVEAHRHALEQIGHILKADTRPSIEIDFSKLIAGSEKESSRNPNNGVSRSSRRH